MYNQLKNLAKRIIPRRILFKNEVFFRRLYSFRLTGGDYYCSICNSSLKKFISFNDKDLLCPVCGSRSRTRRLHKILLENNLLHGKILHFSPSRSLFRVLKNNKGIAYSSTDFEDEFLADFRYDITQIDCKDDTFQLIICYHILEHILDDGKAMKELYRVLAQNGVCLVQTPFKNGEDVYEDATITSEKERERAFGQKDHVRVYSVKGLENRLRENGFSKIEVKKFPAVSKEGLKEETVLVLRK